MSAVVDYTPATGFFVDLDAHRAQRADARDEPTTVRLGGESFAFPPVAEWPIELVDVLGRGELLAAIRMLLDEESFPRFIAQKPTMADVRELFEALGRNAGIGGLGNSQGSAPS